MIPVISPHARGWRERAPCFALAGVLALGAGCPTWGAAAPAGMAPAAIPPAVAATPATPSAIGAIPTSQSTAPDSPALCLASGDGYLRAHLAGAVDASVDWRNDGMRCEGESRDTPPGVRLSFKRVPGGSPDLLFLFGLSGVREGRPARELGANLTLIVQGTDRIYGTLGDSRCTVDSLTQRRLAKSREYRIEARGFCTQPAHAVRGDGAVLVSTFEFAGLVNYEVPKDEVVAFPQGDLSLPGAPPGPPPNAGSSARPSAGPSGGSAPGPER
jgi:hypothetical protein